MIGCAASRSRRRADARCWVFGITSVQRAVSMFIVVVQVVATCTNLVCAVSAGVDVSTRSDLRTQVTVRVLAEVPSCDCGRDAVCASEGLFGARLSGISGFGLEVLAATWAPM